MQTYQYYIDDIQSAVFSPETADPDFLRDAAAQYAEACAEANQRLRQVAQLLRRGLRSEALQLTEEEPNLLDFVGMLDFPELPAWRELLKHWGMAPPPALLIELASDINQAYADHQPLESLLKQHRLFALARAPLAGRIRTLRQIRNADSGNVAWDEDLKILETARIKQMDRDIDSVFRRNDLESLTHIKGELEASDWLVAKPVGLHSKASRLHQDLSAKFARNELEQLEQSLNAVHMAFDVERGFQLRRRWNEAAATAELQPNETLAQRAAPALEWLAEEERLQEERQKRQRAISALEAAIEDSVPPTELGRLYEATLVFDEPIASSLRHRVEQRLAAHSLATQRRHRIVLISIVAAVVLIGGLIGFVVVEQSRRASIAGIVDSLKTLINEGRLEEAQTFYDKAAATSPKITVNRDVQAQKSQLDAAFAAERDRQRQFANSLTQARAAGPDNPDRGALSQARQLARTPEEKQTVAEIDSQIAAAARKLQGEHDAAISERLAEFRTRLQSVESMDRADANAVVTSLARLTDSIDKAKQTFGKANPAILAQLDPLVARIKTIRQAIDAAAQQSQSREAITASIGNAAAFLAALNDFASRFPDSELGGNLQLLEQESNLWKGFAEWSDYVAKLSAEISNVSPERARGLVTDGDRLGKSYGDIQFGELFSSRKPYLESVANRAPESGVLLIAELQKLFRDPLVGSLWLVEAQRNGVMRYYSRKAPQQANGVVKFDYLVGFDLEEKPTSFNVSDTSYIGRSPQSEIADRTLELIDKGNSKSGDWEKNFSGILSQIVKDQRLDPVLKVALLQRVLKVAAAGSTAFAQGFAQYQTELDGASLDLSVSWMNPRDETAMAERKRAEVFVAALPPIVDAIRATADNLRKLRQVPESRYTWVGWLDRDVNGDWRPITPKLQAKAGELVIVVKQTGQNVAGPIVIGKVENGVLRLQENANELFAGRPLFLLGDNSASK